MASFNLGRFLKNPIKGLENAGRTVGKIGRQAAPVVGLIPGVGAPLGAAIGGIGSVMEGRKFKDSLKSAAMGGLSGFANSKLLGGKGVLGVKDALSSAASKVGGAIAHPGSIPGAIGSAAGGLVSGAANNGFGLKDLLGLGLAGYGAYSGVTQSNRDQGQIDALTGKQLGIADEVANRGRTLNATADTLRDPSAQALLDRVKRGPRQVTDFSRFIDPSNPFAKQYTSASPTAASPMPAPALAPPGGLSPISGGSNRTGTIMGVVGGAPSPGGGATVGVSRGIPGANTGSPGYLGSLGSLASAALGGAPSPGGGTSRGVRPDPNQDLSTLPLGSLRKRLQGGGMVASAVRSANSPT
jgi:hypoxanthine phosphoribosyltransferase